MKVSAEEMRVVSQSAVTMQQSEFVTRTRIIQTHATTDLALC